MKDGNCIESGKYLDIEQRTHFGHKGLEYGALDIVWIVDSLWLVDRMWTLDGGQPVSSFLCTITFGLPGVFLSMTLCPVFVLLVVTVAVSLDNRHIGHLAHQTHMVNLEVKCVLMFPNLAGHPIFNTFPCFSILVFPVFELKTILQTYSIYIYTLMHDTWLIGLEYVVTTRLWYHMVKECKRRTTYSWDQRPNVALSKGDMSFIMLQGWL